MFKIGEFSKISNTTVQTLRYYEKIALLAPAYTHPESGYRFYESKQLPTLNTIKVLQQIGLPLDAIKQILEKDNLDTLDYYYQLREHEIQEELGRIQREKQLLELLKKQQREGINMTNYNVQLKTIPARKVMSIRKTLATYDQEGLLWEELYAELQKQHVKMSNPPFGMSIYHDPEYKETNADVEIQSQIVGEYQDTDTVTFYDAPEIQIASVTFQGSFDQMAQVTAALGQWIEANGYHIAGPMINITHVSPAQDPNPENWVNEAAFVVAN